MTAGAPGAGPASARARATWPSPQPMSRIRRHVPSSRTTMGMISASYSGSAPLVKVRLHHSACSSQSAAPEGFGPPLPGIVLIWRASRAHRADAGAGTSSTGRGGREAMEPFGCRCA
jgi:hypothetical protein